MKRILSLILVISMVLMLSACLEIKKKRDPKEMLNIEKKVDMGERTVDLSDNISENGDSFTHSCDLDYDGTNEKISIEIVEGDDYSQKLRVKIGEKSAEYECFDGVIEKVYSCDVAEDDKTRDIAIITREVSDDPRVRILSYGNELACYDFFNEYNESGKSDCVWIGYASAFYFRVNDDTITLEEQTKSAGMWSVYREYALEDGVFKEVPYKKYKILPDFMKSRQYFDDDVTEEEKEKWSDGYIKAYCHYSNESISIEEGEYIKPVYDNGKDRIYVEKENGESGYIDIGYDTPFDREEFNPMYFFLAG